jgi:predicted ATPase
MSNTGALVVVAAKTRRYRQQRTVTVRYCEYCPAWPMTCLDEVQVRDVADAVLLLCRLFKGLWEGAVER